MVGVLYNPYSEPLGSLSMAVPLPKPTLGQRNNNFGNLRTTDPFEGKTGTFKSYDTYETPEMGLRALARVLDTYSTKRGVNTIDALINRYAPASDNTGGSHENYKTFMSQALGIGINDPIDVKALRPQIMDAIIRFENKNRPLASREQLNQAIIDADGTGEDNMARMTLEEDFAMGPPFVYPENEMRYAVGLSNLRTPEKRNLGSVSGSPMPPPVELVNEPNLPASLSQQMTTGPALNSQGMTSDQRGALSGMTGSDFIAEPAVNQGGGILTTPAVASELNQNMPSGEGVLSKLPPEPTMMTRQGSQVSGQRRDQSVMSLPRNDMFSDLIRIGGRGVAASADGGLAAIGAMTDEYGKIEDARNRNALSAYKASLRGGKTSKQTAADQQQIGQIDQALFDMNRAKEYLASGNLTGLFDNNIVGFFDKLSGNKRAVGRKLLERLRVDDTLLRIAQTKGAISNKEMDLFLAPSPDLNDQEIVWEQWINDRMAALNRVRTRLAGGEQVAETERASEAQVNQFGSSVTAPSLNVGQSTTVNGVTVKRIN